MLAVTPDDVATALCSWSEFYNDVKRFDFAKMAIQNAVKTYLKKFVNVALYETEEKSYYFTKTGIYGDFVDKNVIIKEVTENLYEHYSDERDLLLCQAIQ